MENVVNPPQNPTVKKSFTSFGAAIFSKNIENPKPIMKLPIMFTLRVPRGKDKHAFEHKSPIEYLKSAPKPPPKNIARNLII